MSTVPVVGTEVSTVTTRPTDGRAACWGSGDAAVPKEDVWLTVSEYDIASKVGNSRTSLKSNVHTVASVWYRDLRARVVTMRSFTLLRSVETGSVMST